MNLDILLNKIKSTREALGISARKLSLMSGFCSPVVASIERGDSVLSIKTAAKLLETLHAQIDKKLFCLALKTKRTELKLSIPRLALRTGISYATLYKIEHGCIPSMKLCCMIAKELNMPLEELIEWSDKKN